ncbi:RIO-type serine/threonine protein kinase Rio2 [Natronomonas pharaonis DSM 2160]|uniref:non-specific serine/threonine protein kinase n=1 Tax=Natronomonas pharaonis (strain ATCC 35678 / DSM 2160 / CIP 103997 / JCM 8858 / NBRC 14720 / NCIMB 2260 / Gabara) TaxID=348780 RepID=A0A1U7ETI2_NATPD|nr:serine/threonine-protein kinase RIO2 [Natronomonas pharaonis]CAI48215.1 RIO-type serine/threonine protein kinase Rio2 [Natronomonas pharaonis DSM 2160]
MVQNVATQMAELEEPDFHLLSGIEHGMRFSRWVAEGKLPKFSRLDEEELTYRLDRCMDRELIERKTIQYTGYRLTFEGYDALALRTFSERESIDGVGSPLGVGKESDVYEARSFRPLALKFHREGYTNFREVQKEREYTADNEHRSWFYTARKAAEREYDALETLYPEVSVPRPVDQNRHAIVMEKVDGVELSRAKLDADQVVGVAELILEEMATAYNAGYVHADMSEYNVFVAADGVTIFDWPQSVPTEHENSDELLVRDVENLLGHFERKYPSETPAVDERALADALAADEFDSLRAFEQ